MNFFTALQKGTFKPANQEETWYHFAKMTIWKCNSKSVFYLSQVQDMRIRKLLDSKDDLSTGPLILDEKLILEESLDLVMIKLENDLVILILQDYSPAEITEELGISKRRLKDSKTISSKFLLWK